MSKKIYSLLLVVVMLFTFSSANSKEIFILNEAGERIAANYTIDNSTNRINTENVALMDSSFSTSICDANGVEVTINNNHDMSEYSPFEKADYLFNEGIIDEETKIFTYLQAIEMGDCGDIECATEIYDTINRYSAENPGTKIGMKAATLSDDTWTSAVNSYNNEGTLEKGMFTIHYEKDSTQPDYISTTDINKFATMVGNIGTFYDNNSFNRPTFQNGQNTYHIFFVDGVITSLGLHTLYNGGSFIVVDYDKNKTFDNVTKTTAHELFHAIQKTYSPSSASSMGWFKEASASWAGLYYVNKYLSWASSFAKKYLQTTDLMLSDTTDNRNYGLFLFLQYISQNYGGAPAVRRILEAYSNGISIPTALEYCPASGTVSFAELFSKFQAYNIDTRQYNNSNGAYGNAVIKGTDIDLVNEQFYRTTSKHYEYIATSSVANNTLKFNVTPTGSVSLSGISFSIVRYNRTSRMTPIILYANTNNPYSFVISNFSTANTSTTVNRAVIAVNNTDLISYYKTFSVTRT